MSTIVDGTGELPSSALAALDAALARALAALEVDGAELDLRVVDAEEMRALNAHWRDKDRATDVLSFPSGTTLPGGERHLGDVAICLEAARRQGDEAGHGLERELAELALHGLLHLLGYDHETDDGEMNALELDLRPRVLADGE